MKLEGLSDDALIMLRQLMSTWLADPLRVERGERPVSWQVGKRTWKMPGSGRVYGGTAGIDELVERGLAKIESETDQHVMVHATPAVAGVQLTELVTLLRAVRERRAQDRAQANDPYASDEADEPSREKPARAAKEKNVGPKKPGEKKETAASLFRSLILAGELSDDMIFKRVQEKFGLPDNRRSYVDWYRKELVKKGLLKKV
jgi:hypothetical protein